MVDGVPVGLAQTLTAHEDEVLHVAFSHDGKQISSCSKDHHVLIWNCSEDGHFAEHYRRDMAQYGWMHTWASQYNRSDTKLLVSGVVNSVGGEVAVFSTGRGTTEKYEFLCRMVNDPYDFLGCWCSDDYVISGTMINDAENRFISSVWLCKADSSSDDGDPAITPTFPAHLNMNNYVALLAKFVNPAVSRSLKRTKVSEVFTGRLFFRAPFTSDTCSCTQESRRDCRKRAVGPAKSGSLTPAGVKTAPRRT